MLQRKALRLYRLSVINKSISLVKNYYLYAGVAIFAFILRAINLSNPRGFSMDEAYYVPDAASILKHGYETYWGKRADSYDVIANQLLTNDWQNTLKYDANHPPLGKIFISLGMFFFGTDSPVGWRISAVLAGVGVIVVAMMIAYVIFKNKVVSLIAGVALAVDPMAIAMSRTSHLDIFLTFFVALGVLFATLSYSRNKNVYLVISFIFLGLALGIKWSAIYYIALIFLYIVTLGFIKNRKINFVQIIMMVCSSILAYLSTWLLWFIFFPIENAWEKILFFVNNHFHLYNRLSDIDTPHNYKSNAFEWFLQSHPTLFYKDMNGDFVSSISSMPNVVLWYGSLVSLLFFAFIFFVKKVSIPLYSFLVIGIVAGWTPWLFVGDRTIFQYYTVVFQPYLYISLSFFVFIVFKYLVSKQNIWGLLGRMLLLIYIFVSLVISFRLYNGAVGLEEYKDNGSWAIFTNWQITNKELGLYDIGQSKNEI